MELFQNIIVTDVKSAFVVKSPAGRQSEITNRTSFGLSLCQSGQITYTMNGKQYVSKPDVAVLLPKGGSYTLHGDRDGLFPVINFRCKNLDCTQITVIPLSEPEVCIRIFGEMKQLSLSAENRLGIVSAFYRLLDVLRVGADSRPLRFLNKYLEQNLSDPVLSNTRLAEQMGISEVYLRKLFVAYYKTTPKQYIISLRMENALKLLKENIPVSIVAENCGFCDVYYFSRLFKKHTGMTPTEYKNSFL